MMINNIVPPGPPMPSDLDWWLDAMRNRKETDLAPPDPQLQEVQAAQARIAKRLQYLESQLAVIAASQRRATDESK